MANQNLAARAALEWYLDHGVDEMLGDEPVDRRQKLEILKPEKPKTAAIKTEKTAAQPLLTSEAKTQAIELAKAAETLEDLEKAIADFEGIAIKKTATNLVFADGNPKARIMVVGEAPGADEDRQGKPFVGVSGQLLDKILACINLDRKSDDPETAVYISNILNWRPPGNRTPSPQEVEASLPFIEKHIELIQPKLLIFSGGVAAKTLLHTDTSISRLRGKFHGYVPQTIDKTDPIPAIATYHPSYLLRTPGQKKAVWQDMLLFQEKMKTL